MHASDFSGAIEAKEGKALIKIIVSANAKKNEIAGYDSWRKRLHVKIKAPALEGKANKALLDFFAELLGVSKSDVRIVSGDKSSLKTLQVNLAGDKVAEILKALK